LGKYFIVNIDGNMEYLGEFVNFDEADNFMYFTKRQAIWLLGESTAAQWMSVLQGPHEPR